MSRLGPSRGRIFRGGYMRGTGSFRGRGAANYSGFPTGSGNQYMSQRGMSRGRPMRGFRGRIMNQFVPTCKFIISLLFKYFNTLYINTQTINRHTHSCQPFRFLRNSSILLVSSLPFCMELPFSVLFTVHHSSVYLALVTE